jgi:hypothetical protein
MGGRAGERAGTAKLFADANSAPDEDSGLVPQARADARAALPSGRKLRDDIRDQVILDDRDLVLQLQLALFQAGDLQLVVGARSSQRVDGSIEIAMLDPEHFQPLAHFLFGHAASIPSPVPTK